MVYHQKMLNFDGLLGQDQQSLYYLKSWAVLIILVSIGGFFLVITEKNPKLSTNTYRTSLSQ